MASTFGLIMGLAIIIIELGFYLLEKRIYQPFAESLLLLIAIVAILSFATIKFRNIQGGYLSYFNTFRFGFTTIFFACIVCFAYSYVFTKIDTEYSYRELERDNEYMLNAGFSESKIKEIMEEKRKLIDYQLAHLAEILFILYVWNLILGAILCLISSAFLKKNKPIIDES
jgi:hypothetical protein